MENLCEVRTLDGTTIHNGRVLKKGELVELHPFTAEEWVKEGRATYTVPVRAVAEGVLIGNRVLAIGEKGETSEVIARRLHKAGLVEVLDVSKLRDPGPLGRPDPKPAPAAPPSSNAVTARVEIKKPFMHGSNYYEPGENSPAYMQLPVDLLERFIATGHVVDCDGVIAKMLRPLSAFASS